MPADLTSWYNALKFEFGRKAIDQLNTDHWLYNRLTRKTRKLIDGYKFKMAIRTGRSPSSFAMHHKENFHQTAGTSRWANPVVYPKLHVATYEPNWFLMQMADTEAKAFSDPTIDGMDEMLEAWRSDVGRALWSDGSGILAQTTGNNDTATPVPVQAYLWGGTTNQGKYLIQGTHLSVIQAADKDTLYSGAESSEANGLTLTADWNVSDGIAFTGTLTGNAAAHNICKFGSGYRTSNSGVEFTEQTGQKEMMGLYGIVSAADPFTGGLHAVTVGSEPKWVSSVKDGSAGLTPQLMYDLWFDILEKSGEEIDLIVSSYGVRGKWYGILYPDVRHATGSAPLQNKDLFVTDKGHEYGAPWFADQHGIDNTIFMLNTKHLEIKQVCEPQFLDKNTAKMLRIHGTLRSEAVWAWGAELTTDKRNAHGKIYSLPA